uniref:Ricin B-type lectin domain-containing protein n=1 Tax=Macrostomum lignano TaxID=282301 RepID=A0A1I8F8C1_9PLAT
QSVLKQTGGCLNACLAATWTQAARTTSTVGLARQVCTQNSVGAPRCKACDLNFAMARKEGMSQPTSRLLCNPSDPGSEVCRKTTDRQFNTFATIPAGSTVRYRLERPAKLASITFLRKNDCCSDDVEDLKITLSDNSWCTISRENTKRWSTKKYVRMNHCTSRDYIEYFESAAGAAAEVGAGAGAAGAVVLVLDQVLLMKPAAAAGCDGKSAGLMPHLQLGLANGDRGGWQGDARRLLLELLHHLQATKTSTLSRAYLSPSIAALRSCIRCLSRLLICRRSCSSESLRRREQQRPRRRRATTPRLERLLLISSTDFAFQSTLPPHGGGGRSLSFAAQREFFDKTCVSGYSRRAPGQLTLL